MTFADLSPLANHLWQSTLCVAVAWLLTLGMRKNRAAVRYGLWMAASVKFLIPFSLLVSAGAQLEWRAVPITAPPQLSSALDEIAQPFAAPAPPPLPAVAAPALNPWPAILFAVWLGGIAIGIVFWVRCWWQVRSMRRAATPLEWNLPVKVMSSPTHREPGVLGIRKPCLLLPEGIADRLTPPQLEAILAHELRHVERRDNLTAAIHMLVETIFWFHPCVWWIRARLMEERERACDEEVLRMGSEPQVYAESIIKVCEFYLASPAPSAGVTGGELKKRIEGIMANRIFHKLNLAQKLLLAVAAIGAVGGPIAVGLAGAPRAQSQAQAVAAVPQAPGAGARAGASLSSFEVASVKPGTQPVRQVTGGMTGYGPPCNGGPGTQDPGRLSCRVTLSRFTSMAFNLKRYQSKFPAWMETAWFDITAIVPAGATKEDLRVMEQDLLKERFKLATHVEKRKMQVYLLSVAENGPKLKEARDPAAPEDISPISGPAPLGKSKLDADGFLVLPRGYGSTSVAMRGDSMRIRSAGTTMEQFASFLSTRFDNSVEDATGLQGKYDITVMCSSASVFGITSGPDDGSASAPAGVPTFAEALKQQLGLKLDAMSGLVDVLIIDHVEKVPTEN